MAVALGYGGLANTNGARSFAGKAEEAGVKGNMPMQQMGWVQQHIRGLRSIVFLLFGA